MNLTQKILDYYDVGKVFKFKKMLDASLAEDKNTKVYNEGANVVFHI